MSIELTPNVLELMVRNATAYLVNNLKIHYGISEIDSYKYTYTSNLYTDLIATDTGMWTYGDAYLFKRIEEELDSMGIIKMKRHLYM